MLVEGIVTLLLTSVILVAFARFRSAYLLIVVVLILLLLMRVLYLKCVKTALTEVKSIAEEQDRRSKIAEIFHDLQNSQS